jgi:hypothetical protein
MILILNLLEVLGHLPSRWRALAQHNRQATAPSFAGRIGKSPDKWENLSVVRH